MFFDAGSGAHRATSWWSSTHCQVGEFATAHIPRGTASTSCHHFKDGPRCRSTIGRQPPQLGTCDTPLRLERDPGPSPRRRIRRNPYLGFFAHAPNATDGSWIWIDDQGNVQEEGDGLLRSHFLRNRTSVGQR